LVKRRYNPLSGFRELDFANFIGMGVFVDGSILKLLIKYEITTLASVRANRMPWNTKKK